MSIVLTLKVMPNSGRREIKLDRSGIIKCYVKNPPEYGKANAEVIKFLAKQLVLPEEKVRLISGKSTRKKKILIDANINLDEVYQLLALEFPQLTI